MTTKTSIQPREITDEQRLTMLKHLASGKDLDTVATITGHDRALVLDIVSKHGYPNSLDKGIELLAAKIEKDRHDEIPQAGPLEGVRVPRPATTSPSSVTSPDARPAGGPDEIRVLINAAKNHPSKKIQNQADRILDHLEKLRDLFAEDEAKHAAKRREDAEKAAVRAEVERLEKALAAAKAKLRGTPRGASTPSGGGTASTRTLPTREDRTCPDCGKALHTNEAGLRLHRMRAHPDEAA